MKVFLTEKDQQTAETIQHLLINHHYLVDLIPDSETAKVMVTTFSYDLILLSWRLPDRESLRLCQSLRAEGNNTPIILLADQDDGMAKVRGLDAGADDCLLKPFKPEELLARIRAVLRRTAGIASPVLRWGELCLDPVRGEVNYRRHPVPLTPKEYSLLELFLRNPHRVFSLDDLLDRLWSFEESPYKNAVRTQIKGLRQKLKRAGLTDNLIETVYGLGYRLVAEKQANSLQQPQTTAITSISKTNTLNLETLWQPIREIYEQRIVKLSTLVSKLNPEERDQALRQQLIHEVHNLTGSLGSFGFSAITTCLQSMEEILQSNPHLSSQHLRQLNELATQVEQQLQRTPSGLESTFTSFEIKAPQVDFPRLLVLKGEEQDGWTQTLAATAANYRIQAQVVDEISQAKRAIATHPPDIILLKVSSAPDPTTKAPLSQLQSDLELLADLKQSQAKIPILVLSPPVSFDARMQVIQMGATQLLQTPVTPSEVLDTVNLLLQKSIPPTARLLIVDDDPEMLVLLQQLLQPWGFQLHLLNDPQHFWETLERVNPDLILLDIVMPRLSGFDLCQALRSSPRWQELPILFLSAHTDAQTIQQVFATGADDYIRKPLVAPELLARVLSWLKRSRIQQLQSNVDSLTRVANQRKSTQDLTRLLGLAHRQGQPLSFALIDFDGFKYINDEYGHTVGDLILRRFGDCLKLAFREEDVVARWGGEEFVVGLYGISQAESIKRLSEFLLIWQQEIVTSGAQSIHPSISVGIAVYPQDALDLQGLYRAADKALTQAKAAGQNQVFPKA